MFELKNINKSFGKQKVLSDINLNINKGEKVCLVGGSGCGKTTLLNIMSGLLIPDSGEILLNGQPIDKVNPIKNRIIDYLPCGDSLLESLTVRENLMYATGKSEKEINDIMSSLCIQDISDSYPYLISTGEYKRVCFARSLLKDWDILLLDEPTSNLDDKSANVIISHLNDLDKTMIIATHDIRLKIKSSLIKMD